MRAREQLSQYARLQLAEQVAENRDRALAAEKRAKEAYEAEHPEPARIDFTCGTCKARPGDPCIGRPGRSGFHGKRSASWAAARRSWVAAVVTAGDDAYCEALLAQ